MGMVGGGRDAFIGAVHRMAAQLDGLVELACGAFSSDAAKSRASGADLFLPSHRVYASYEEMFRAERALPEGERMDFVSIVTPNHLHFPVAKSALEHGFPVMCEKPMTFDVEEAVELQKIVSRSGLLFGLTHNYSGYPLVKEARARVRAGELGDIRKVVVEYPQGWLSTRLEETGQKQASWRTDPERAGASCCVGDIGTHAQQLAEYVTGLRIESVCADLTTFVPGRSLDDDVSALLRFEGGARGTLMASQIAVSEENGLHLRVYGSRGGLQWRQEEPNTLILLWPDRPREIVRAGVNHAYLSDDARRAQRLPCGHPEGFLEAFANLYRNYALALSHVIVGEKPRPENLDFPRVEDGVRGMAFVRAIVESGRGDRKWVTVRA